jgi:ABC-2 type transport system permease protein
MSAPLTETQKALVATLPYDFTAAALIVTMLIVAVFYCLGALHNERRDRSILFWKSLPVPDVTAVAAKAILPLVVMPVAAFVIILATLALMLALSAAGLAAHGKGLAELGQMPIVPLFGVILYGIAIVTLWWAPIYGWLLMVSGWAKRAPFLWAVLPPLLLAVTEQIALGSDHLGSLIQYRLFGAYPEGFVVPTKAELAANHGLTSLPVLDPGKFFAAPGLWEGLVAAVIFIAAAVWLRRYREPT